MPEIRYSCRDNELCGKYLIMFARLQEKCMITRCEQDSIDDVYTM